METDPKGLREKRKADDDEYYEGVPVPKAAYYNFEGGEGDGGASSSSDAMMQSSAVKSPVIKSPVIKSPNIKRKSGKAAATKRQSPADETDSDAPTPKVSAIRELSQMHYDLDAKGIPILTTSLTGAKEGDILEGVVRPTGDNDSVGVVLQIVKGFIPASTVISHSVDGVDGTKLIDAYIRDYGISDAVAKLAIKNRIMSPNETDNAHSIGSGCPDSGGEHSVYGDSKGKICTCAHQALFQILQPGAWADIADEFGNKEKLMEYIIDGTVVTWRQILQLFGNKSLMLRSRLFSVGVGAHIISNPDPETSLSCNVTLNTITYSIPYSAKNFGNDIVEQGSLAVTVDRADANKQSQDVTNVIRLVALALEDVEYDLASLYKIHTALVELTQGGLKSALQKVVRFSPEHFILWDNTLVKACEYAAVACAMLAVNPGGFVPELQTVTRGCTAALKRAGVILIEDSFANTVHDLHVLMGTALVSQYMRSFHPCEKVIVMCIRSMYNAALSTRIIDWRSHMKDAPLVPRVTSGVIRGTFSITGHDEKELANSAKMLDILGSFEGDKRMFHKVAELAIKHHKLPMLEWNGKSKLHAVPSVHIWDQHAQRGVAHILKSKAATFRERYVNEIFIKVTGINPRIEGDNMIGFEEKPNVKEVRFTQFITMRFTTPKLYPRTILDVIFQENASYKVDPGTLAAGIGYIQVTLQNGEVKGGKGTAKAEKGAKDLKLYVMVGTVIAEKEVVMLVPSRSSQQDYLQWGENSETVELERKAAIRFARSNPHPVSSPLLPKGHSAVFREGKWTFMSKPWEGVVRDGIEVTVDLHNPPQWIKSLDTLQTITPLLENNDIISDALSVIGTGLCKHARKYVVRLCNLTPPHIVSRAHSLIRQQFERLNMPVPALDGGLGSDQLQAYPGDWDVWRWLVILSRIVPGALRPTIAPRFAIPNAVLLVMVSSWIIHDFIAVKAQLGSSLGSSSSLEKKNPWQSKLEWTTAYAQSQIVLRQHQKDAIARLRERQVRGAPGHYLVMGTGHGKTYTALTYCMWRMLHTDLGNRVRRIIWVTPPGAKIPALTPPGAKKELPKPYDFQLIKSLVQEFDGAQDALIVVPFHYVEKKNAVAKNGNVFKDYAVNIIHQDHIRTMMPELIDVAMDSIMIFDEGDAFYGVSQRTSNALRLAALCAEFIIQTATPVPSKGNIDRLRSWLALTEEFPVSARNYLVAACNLIYLKIDLGIKSTYIEIEIPQTQISKDAFSVYMHEGNDWAKLFRVLQAETNRQFCEYAHMYALEDRAQNITGGCLAVCDSQPHVRTLIALFKEMFPTIGCGDSSEIENPDIMVMFVAALNNRGYNGAVRFGVMIRQPYPGSPNERIQMEGRIRRISQHRSEVKYVVVYMKDSMMSLLYERQSRDQNANLTLEAVAKIYNRDVLDLVVKL